MTGKSWKITPKGSKSCCQALTKSGKPCQAAATSGGLCFFHANPCKRQAGPNRRPEQAPFYG
ncbi:MAG: DUF5763 domain-containing protein [Candidatus Sulfotelmatobacter sp.]